MFWAPVRRRLLLSFLLTGFLLFCIHVLTVFARSAKSQATKPAASPVPNQSQQTDPLQRPISKKKQKDAQKLLKAGQESPYKKWLDQDVIYIITSQERAAFMQLSNDEERDQFIETFWQRRDPTPDTIENEYRDEHYRRITYANEHFSAGVPGWKTDRGRIYIIHGPPDEIESHPSGGTYDRTPQEGGGSTSTFPFERWRYRYVEDVGQEVVVEFVDTCMCGDYHMTMDPNEKDALAHTPTGRPLRGMPFMNGYQQLRQFDDMERFVGMSQPPKIHFKDLYEVVTHTVNVNLLPFDVVANFARVTEDTVLVPIVIQIRNRDITFANKDGVERGTLNLFGRVTTLTGRVVQTFEDTVQVDIPYDLLPKLADNPSIYGKSLPLAPGHYRLDIAIKDLNGDRTGSWYHSIVVPEYRDERLSASSLILADRMERMATSDIGTGAFAIGDTIVRPRVPGPDGVPHFKKDQKISIWMQVYSLKTDPKTNRPSATAAYDILNEPGGQTVIHEEESSGDLGLIGGQATLRKTLHAGNLMPGTYKLRIRVTDKLSGQTIEPSEKFVVE
jgi:GWxTD domain-containing protein